jgi:hypothetical protein
MYVYRLVWDRLDDRLPRFDRLVWRRWVDFSPCRSDCRTIVISEIQGELCISILHVGYSIYVQPSGDVSTGHEIIDWDFCELAVPRYRSG